MGDKFLSSCPIFQSLSESERRHLEEAAEEKTFLSGKVIFREGERARTVWVVKRGWVRLVKQNGLPHPRTVFVLTSAEIFCGISAFDHTPYSATGIAATDSVLLQIPIEVFDEFLDHSTLFARQILRVCCDRIRHMAESFCFSQATVETRILHVLKHLQRDFGSTLPFTHREIAEMAGTTVETSIRTLSRLKKKGCVRSSRGKIVLLQSKKSLPFKNKVA